MKIVALFPETEGLDNQLLNTDKAIGLRDFLKDSDHELVILKNGEDLSKTLKRYGY